MKAVAQKKTSKSEREYQVLVGLIEHYIETGAPVGSNTLQEGAFKHLSSATIRNYFAHLESEGYLTQQHASGGRIPTELAFKLYTSKLEEVTEIPPEQATLLKSLKNRETREISTYLQEATEKLSEITQCAAFISAPRFDHDYIDQMKLLPLDNARCLCAIVTNFGVVQTEILQVDMKLGTFSLKRIEDYFQWRLAQHDEPKNLQPDEEQLAQQIYNEMIVRYVIRYSNFTEEDVYRTGFSKLLVYPEFRDAPTLANTLSVLENKHTLRLLLKETSSKDQIRCWIGSDFVPFTATRQPCTVLAIPYYINKVVVGSVGLMGPMRMPYKNMYGVLKAFSNAISDTLTQNIYKFKISFRQASIETPFLKTEEHQLLSESQPRLLEDKRQTTHSIQ